MKLCLGCASTCVLPGTAQLLTATTGSATTPAFTCACAERSDGSCLFAARIGELIPDEGPRRRALLTALATSASAIQRQGRLQHVLASGLRQHPSRASGMREMAARLQHMGESARVYESPRAQAAALARIPLAELHHRAAAAAAAARQRDAADAAAAADPSANNIAAVNSDSVTAFFDDLLKQLVLWFKTEFFKWTNAPACEQCSGGDTDAVGAEPARTPQERAGQAGRVELYRCKSCSHVTRFPRYNNPETLLDWRQGRCGEVRG